MKRVVVTGMGIWSCIGQDLQTVTESLRQGRSGIIFDPKRIEYGLQSGLVGNVPRPYLKPLLPRKFRATMSEDAEYAYMAARQAFTQAGIDDEFLKQSEVGIIWGSDYMMNGKREAHQTMEKEHNSLLIDPSTLFKSESSSVTMNLSGIWGLKGINMCLGASCSSSAYAIAVATMFIRQGMQDIILVGGSNEISPYGACLFDGIGALSKQNNTPALASKPFDKSRDGFVPSGGGAALILEDYEHANQRGAHILAEIIGIGFTAFGNWILSKGYENAVKQCILNALQDAGITAIQVDYINPYSAPIKYDSIIEGNVLSELFTNNNTVISSTEAITGHEFDMAGAGRTIYTILMMQNNFIAPQINLNNVVDEAVNLNFVRKLKQKNIDIALVNSSGTGGTNCTLILKKI